LPTIKCTKASGALIGSTVARLAATPKENTIGAAGIGACTQLPRCMGLFCKVREKLIALTQFRLFDSDIRKVCRVAEAI
jgi:hypothetical protein